MTREEKQKAIYVLKNSAPVFPLKKPEEYNDYVQAIKQVIDWLEQEPTTKNNLAVDKEQLKTMIRGLTKWYVKRDNTEVGEPNTAVGLLYDDVMFGIDGLSPATPQQRIGKWIKSRDGYGNNHYTCPFCEHDIATKADTWGDNYCSNCGAKLQESEE